MTIPLVVYGVHTVQGAVEVIVNTAVIVLTAVKVLIVVDPLLSVEVTVEITGTMLVELLVVDIAVEIITDP